MSKRKTIFNAAFDVFAETYHSVRPGYPALLYADIKELCGIGEGSRILEIGAGSGIATVELAKFGCKIVAIEPGSHLAAIARKQTNGLKNVEIIEETFENFEPPDRFDAILAFTAYHWINEDTKHRKILNLMNDAGSLALVWNSFFLSDSAVTAEVHKAYRECLPDAYPNESSVAEVNKGVLAKLRHREQEVIQNPLLYTVALRKYCARRHYDSETYPKLLNTFPKIVGVPEEQRKKFLARISEIVRRYGTIAVPVLTTLLICRKREDFLRVVSSTEGSR